MKRLVLLGSLFAGVCAHGAYWTNSLGGALEDEGNWNKLFSAWTTDVTGLTNTEAVTFGFASDVTLTTALGFMNGGTTITATNCIVTVDIPSGKEWFTTGFNVRTRDYNIDTNPDGWNLVHVKGGGKLQGGGNVEIGTGAQRRNQMVLSDEGTTLASSTYDIAVGPNAHYNSLIVSNGARIAAWRSFGVGCNGGAYAHVGSHNDVLFTGEGTRFQYSVRNNDNSGCVAIVGESGAFNTLTFEKGAVCTNLPSGSGSFVIGQWFGGDFNNMVVRDTGSCVSNSGISVGPAGNFNRLDVSNNASAFFGTINIGSLNGRWVGSPAVYYSYVGKGNSIVVSGGGTINSGHISVGANIGTEDNTLIVEGTNSALRVTAIWSDISMYGTNNTITVTDGGALSTDRDLILGGYMNSATAYGSSNRVFLSSGATGTVVSGTTIGGGAGENVHASVGDRIGNGIIVTSNAFFNCVGIAIGATTNTFDNYITVEEDATVAATGTVYLGQYGSENWIGVGPGGTFNVPTLFVGWNGVACDNRLEVWDGGKVFSPNEIYIGNSVNCHRNKVAIRGGGSSVTLLYDFYLGANGSSNRLEISDGGLLSIPRHTYIGRYATASNNVVSVHNGTLFITGTNNVGNSHGSQVLCSNMTTIVLSGTNPVFYVNGKINLHDSTTLHIAFDAVAPTSPFIQTGTLSVSPDTTLTMDAKKLALAGGLKDFPLVTCASAQQAALEALRDSFDAEHSTGIVTFQIVDSKRLLCNVANEAATLIRLR